MVEPAMASLRLEWPSIVSEIQRSIAGLLLPSGHPDALLPVAVVSTMLAPCQEYSLDDFCCEMAGMSTEQYLSARTPRTLGFGLRGASCNCQPAGLRRFHGSSVR